MCEAERGGLAAVAGQCHAVVRAVREEPAVRIVLEPTLILPPEPDTAA
ncbi:hypothetical protein [Streptomyces sp. SAS_276]